jgi:predicted RNase H-like HicB family nuclease
MARYLALIDGKKGASGGGVPDLPGCTSGGSTTDAASRQASFLVLTMSIQGY